MAYINITTKMVDAARNATNRSLSTTDVRAMLEAALRAAEISMDAAPAPTNVVVWFNGDESVRCQVGGPAVEFADDAHLSEVRSVQVAPR